MSSRSLPCFKTLLHVSRHLHEQADGRCRGCAVAPEYVVWFRSKTKEECVIRHVATALLVLGLGITAMVPVGFAQVNVAPNSSFTNRYGNQVAPLTPGGGGGGGAAGNTACPLIGPCAVCPLIGPCYEPQYNRSHGGDTH
jgi:hypothetical protein